MIIARYDQGFGEEPIRFGEVSENTIFELSGDTLEHPGSRTNIRANMDEVDILCPIENPPMIICIGLNYRLHARELGKPEPKHPVVFFKSPGSIQHPGASILRPKTTPAETRVDYEAELAVIIGGPGVCKNIRIQNVFDFVLGYTCANDVSARDWQLDPARGGGQWCRGKMFDTFSPLGPFVATRDSIPDPQNLRIGTKLNGAVVQDSNTSDMIFSVAALIEFLSMSTTLPGGTVILTGTPAGVGLTTGRFLQAGDNIEVTIEGIGTLHNAVEDDV